MSLLGLENGGFSGTKLDCGTGEIGEFCGRRTLFINEKKRGIQGGGGGGGGGSGGGSRRRRRGDGGGGGEETGYRPY
jgi:hypothetical protein